MEVPKINLKLGRKNYPMLLKHYGLEKARITAIKMCIAQYPEVTEANLYSCLSNLEIGSGRDVRLTKKQAKDIRQACLTLLNSKSDSEMTEEDKNLLRQYEGAGGLGSEDASVHGTLYEYYTPRNVTKKVWDIVDKYIPGAKAVLEPSAGIGRFAEDRPNDKFTLNEYDETSSRISGILHPAADIKKGAFQEMFKPGKDYTGKKYDVVIGNPPYGSYEGLWKGKGEGKDHKRYEEYFIDRGLDTLREGGIMAFVVPSAFLRGGNDKIKEKIAAKGKLLEAWRLPNGTFNTTGVGTDIIVIRKEKGDPSAFSDNAYFAENPEMVMGTEAVRNGKFGEETYVALNGDDSFDDAINRIDAAKVEAVAVSEKTTLESAIENVTVEEPPESEAEKERNRSEAMRGNKNAEKDGITEETPEQRKKKTDLFTLDDFNKQYNKSFDKDSLTAWKNTNWDGTIDTGKFNTKFMENSPDFVKSFDGKWYSVVNYASGDIYEKIAALEANKEDIDKKSYERQKAILEEALPAKKTIYQFDISPLESLAETFVTSEKGRARDFHGNYDGATLNEAFKEWVRFASPDILALPGNVSKEDIQNYVNKETVRAARGATEVQKEANRLEAERLKTDRRVQSERLFNQFVREQLIIEDQERLAHDWNRLNNAVATPDYSKIPVFVDGISKTFKGNDFRANESQIKGNSWLANQGNGIVAFDVGVGKTVTAIMAALTPEGWKAHGEIQVGDTVFAVDGTPAKVLKLFPQGEQDIYCVTFSDGSKMECTKEHLWNVQLPWMRNKAQNPGHEEKWVTKELQDIMLELRNNRGERRYTIPMCKPIQFEPRTLKLHPYSLGYLLGNGCFKDSAVSVTIPDDSTLQKMKNTLPQSVSLKHADNMDWRISRCGESGENEVLNVIRDYGLGSLHSYEKFIPNDYKFTSVEDRVDLLHGLMDADGYIDSRGTTPLYYTTSEKLAFGVRELVQSLGGTVSITSKVGKYRDNDGNQKECRVCYTLSIRLIGINPFSLKRKAERVKEKVKYLPVRYINNVEYIGRDLATCILIDHPSHLYITRDYLVTHNTVTAIMAAMQDIQMGRAKKPLIVVPKAVYKNWIKEIGELFPNTKINDLNNFGEIAKYKGADGRLNIEEGSITVATEEALQKIGFSNETLDGELRESFMEALSAEQEGDSDRKKAKDEESIMTKVGQASRVSDDNNNWINFEDTGFDHITVDEAHRFRNSFKKPRSVNRGDADEFKDIPSGGAPALRGLKLFAITQMIQKANNGRNVHLLTATPFQNSPVEIYNMLSYVAREPLKKMGILNFHEFLSRYAELKPELAVNGKNQIVQKNVMKGFKNLQSLQKLLNQYCMKIDGEDAGIVRPDAEKHTVELTQTPEQRDMVEKIRAYMEANPSPDPDKGDPGATLRCLNALRAATISPALIDGFAFLDKTARAMAGITESSITVENKDFVRGSPKMTFICDSVAEKVKKNPTHGQIIYLPQGVKRYPDVKEYLVSQGVPAESIAFMAPEYLPAGDTGNDRKEEITAAFNDPDNKIKIIIGSDTIKEGVNLNGNTDNTYFAQLPWNPTDVEQIIGRSHRQGNKQGLVHINFPLMADSVDSFMYQKHDEKGSRLNTLWNTKENSMEVGGIDPEELKFSLIKDPKKRADLYIKEKTASLTQKQKIAEGTSDKLFSMAGDRKNLSEEAESYQKDIENRKKAIADFTEKSDAALIKEHELDFSESYSRYIYDDYASVHGKDMKELRANYIKAVREGIADAQKTIARAKGKMATIDNTLKHYGIDDPANMATVERVQKRYSQEAIGYTAQIKAIEDNRENYIKEAEAEIKKESRPGLSVAGAVDQNLKETTGHHKLYSMEEVKIRKDYKGGTLSREEALKRLVSEGGYEGNAEEAEKRLKEWDSGDKGGKTLKKSNGKKKMVLLMKRRSA